MFIELSMNKTVITADPETGILAGKELLENNRIRHLPIVDKDNRLIGVVTDRDIRSAMPSSVLSEDELKLFKEKITNLKLRDIMVTNPITISPKWTLPDAILLMNKHSFGAFPVVDENGILKGIISVRDMMRAFVNVLNIGEPGTLLGILADDNPGQMKKIVDAITEEQILIGSILVCRRWQEGKRVIYPYIFTLNSIRIKKKLESMGFTILNPMEWYLDHFPKNE